MVFTEHVKIREEKFGAVVFETLREKVFVSNETGKDILSLLEKGYSLDEIVDILSKNYSCDDIEQIEKDTKDFIAQLKNNGIINEKL